MSGPRKHPLEVYRDAFKAKRKPRAEAGTSKPEPVATDSGRKTRKPGRDGGEFELRLSLNGALIVLFVWVTLLGASYLYGYRRATEATETAALEQAENRGRRMEMAASSASEPSLKASVPAASDAAPALSNGPRWGVLLVSYDKAKEELLKATVSKLKDEYGFPEEGFATAFDPKRQVIELYAGSFAAKDDPGLAELLERVVNIKDWQKSDPQPFKGAQIRSFVYGK